MKKIPDRLAQSILDVICSVLSGDKDVVLIEHAFDDLKVAKMLDIDGYQSKQLLEGRDLFIGGGHLVLKKKQSGPLVAGMGG